MLDFNKAVETSFDNMHNAPRFELGALVPVNQGASSDTRFINKMEASFQEYQIDIARWLDGGRAHRAEIEGHFREFDGTLKLSQIIHIQFLVDDITERMEQDAEANSRRLKHMVKMGRRAKELSPTVGTFIIKFAGRVRSVAEAEMNEMAQAIDWWKGISARYDPTNKRSRIFDDPKELIAHLQSV